MIFSGAAFIVYRISLTFTAVMVGTPVSAVRSHHASIKTVVYMVHALLTPRVKPPASVRMAMEEIIAKWLSAVPTSTVAAMLTAALW